MSSEKPKTREVILRAAWTLLEAGPASGPGAGVRMSDIAKQAGISRQALYLHFPTRAELLLATVRYLDEIKNIENRLKKSRAATSGVERLDAFIDAWGNYIPEIYGVAKAFLAMLETDEAAAISWNDRMQAVRHGCHAVAKALKADGTLSHDHSVNQATDILWTLLSVRNWEQLTVECAWSQKKYIKMMKLLAARSLLEPGLC